VTLDEAAQKLAAAGIESPRAEARLLLAHALGVSRDETLQPVPLTPEQALAFDGLVARRAAREPSAYIIGHREFWSMDFRVGRGVLVPRPDSETLIEEVLRIFPDRSEPLHIADLGTGSGILLIAALKEFPHATGIGFESSDEAFAWGHLNAERLAMGRAEIRHAGWDEAAQNAFDLILSNPPYIPSGEIGGLDPEVARHEPRAALDGGPDGLDAYRALAGLLPRLLRRDGCAILEIGAGQAPEMEPLFRDSGLKVARVIPDLAGIPRALVLEKTATPLGKRSPTP
jgi:release factor glutamine methyltransferase